MKDEFVAEGSIVDITKKRAEEINKNIGHQVVTSEIEEEE
nr:MAG TPA: hypothetical protein [Caudoviricetes sp.]